MKKTTLGVIALLIASNVNATDARIKTVPFHNNEVVPVHGLTFTTTHIKFGEHEKVLDIEGGDTTAWMVTYHDVLPNVVFVKPTALGSSTNLTVISNQHTYYFHLMSNERIDKHPVNQTYSLQFSYFEPKHTTTIKTAVTPPTPKVVNAAYRFSGSPQLVPKHVFDDGQFTYFELSTQDAVPAIFAVDDKSGKESTVNTRRQGKYLVVQRIAPQFTLRQGALATSVFNTHEISRIAANRRPV